MLSDTEVDRKMLEKRILPVIGKITQERMNELRGNMLALALESADDIRIVIDSGGGECEPALFVIDTIQMLPVSVVGIVNGRCNSSAVTLLCGCHKRIALRHSRFHVHNIARSLRVSLQHDDTLTRSRYDRDLHDAKRILEQIVSLTAKRTGRPEQEIVRLMHYGDDVEAFYTADEFKGMGFLDEVVDSYPLLGK